VNVPSPRPKDCFYFCPECWAKRRVKMCAVGNLTLTFVCELHGPQLTKQALESQLLVNPR
jgi:hypothetical protein